MANLFAPLICLVLLHQADSRAQHGRQESLDTASAGLDETGHAMSDLDKELDDDELRQEALPGSPISAISPTTITVGVPTKIVLTGTSKPGDRAEIKENCASNFMLKTEVTPGTNAETVFKLDTKVEGDYKICYQKFGESSIDTGLTIKVVSPTSTGAISDIDLDTVVLNVPTTIKLTMTGINSEGKATFIPFSYGCKQAEPDTDIDAEGKGSFTISGAPGKYKLCYQSAGATDSIEQVSAKNTEGITIMVVESAKTLPDMVTAVYPDVITVNVPTMLYFTGVKEGAKAAFVNRASGDCSQVDPTRDVGAGHALFTISSSGNYTACLRIAAANDCVEQVHVNIWVRSPGVIQEQVNRWPKDKKKSGAVDCKNMTMVTHCSVSRQSTCNKTFIVASAVAYPCSWQTEPFPGACKTNSWTTSEAEICRQDTCGSETNVCW